MTGAVPGWRDPMLPAPMERDAEPLRLEDWFPVIALVPPVEGLLLRDGSAPDAPEFADRFDALAAAADEVVPPAELSLLPGPK